MSLEVIVSDLDGTLLNSHKKISDFTAKTLIEYEKQGKTVVLASGRYAKEISAYAKQLQLEKYKGYMVCGNGFEVIDCQNKTVHQFEKIALEEAKKIVELANQNHLYQYIQIDGKYHLSAPMLIQRAVQLGHHSLKFLQKHGLKKFTYTTHLLNETIYCKNMLEPLKNDVVKIAVSGIPSQLKQFQEQLKQFFPHQFAFYYVNSFSLEVTSHTVSKKNAVQYVCEQLGYSLDNVIAFGDSGNDEPLLQAARIGITMKNGSHQALACARVVSQASNDEEGVAKELIRYLKKSDRA